jgi:hypothetical protein
MSAALSFAQVAKAQETDREIQQYMLPGSALNFRTTTSRCGVKSPPSSLAPSSPSPFAEQRLNSCTIWRTRESSPLSA